MSLPTGFSGRSLPFFGLPSSRIVSGAPSAEEAIRLAELDWTVSVQPDFQRITVPTDSGLPSYEYRQIPDRFLSVRDDTQTVLGNVGKVWRPFQNHEAFSFADGLLEYGAEFLAAGHYNNGQDVFLTAQLPEGITVPDTDDNLDLYLLLRNNHAGKGSISASVIPMRIWCTNMLNLAVQNAINTWKCRHTSSAVDKIEEAIRTLNLVSAYRTEFENVATQLRETEVNLDGFTALVNEITEAPRIRTGLVETWNSSPTVDRRTGWGAVNAIGEFFEHENNHGRIRPESRFASNLDGPIANARNRAVRLLIRR